MHNYNAPPPSSECIRFSSYISFPHTEFCFCTKNHGVNHRTYTIRSGTCNRINAQSKMPHPPSHWPKPRLRSIAPTTNPNVSRERSRCWPITKRLVVTSTSSCRLRRGITRSAGGSMAHRGIYSHGRRITISK